MTSLLQIAFLVLAGVVYASSFLLIWIGLFPEDGFSAVLSRWSMLVPFAAIAMPFLTFVVFVLGYDPRTQWLKRLRLYLLSGLKTTKALLMSLATLAIILTIVILLIVRTLARPPTESLQMLVSGNFENAATLAKGQEASHSSSRVVWLVAESEMEAKRRQSTSDSHTEVAVLRLELPAFDMAFAPLWHRYLAQRGLGKLAFCRKDINGMALHFTRAERVARWLDTSIAKAALRAYAAGLFSMSGTEKDVEKKRKWLDAAETILQTDASIASQRVLGNIYYTKSDYGGAYRIWKSILDRDPSAQARGLEIPNAIERKRLNNNIALARLKQSQPKAALNVVEDGLKQQWDSSKESHRTVQVRLLSTKVLCLIALDKPDEALEAFEARRQVSTQIRDEGLTTGSYLLKANILAAIWGKLPANDPKRIQIAKTILHSLLFAREPGRDLHLFRDFSRQAFSGLVDDVATLWRWDGITFDQKRCEEAIFTIVP